MRLRHVAGNTATLAIIAATFAAAPGHAAEQITASFPNRFDPSTEEMDQGERLTFLNADTSPLAPPHDVTATESGPDGDPLFKSETIPPGPNEVPVAGSEYLAAGTYEFFCSVHPLSMRATLTVTTAGAPVPRPGSEPSQAPAADTTPPNQSVSIAGSRVSTVRKHGKLAVDTGVSEAAEVKLAATGRIGRRSFELGSGTFTFSTAGDRRLRVRLTRAARRALRDAARNSQGVQVEVRGEAKDEAGNVGHASAKRKLRA